MMVPSRDSFLIVPVRIKMGQSDEIEERGDCMRIIWETGGEKGSRDSDKVRNKSLGYYIVFA